MAAMMAQVATMMAKEPTMMAQMAAIMAKVATLMAEVPFGQRPWRGPSSIKPIGKASRDPPETLARPPEGLKKPPIRAS